MGSVTDNMNCPRCNYDECLVDFYYKTGEEYIHCSECGYLSEYYIKRGKDGKPIKKNKSKDCTYDNIKFIRKTIAEPYGAYRVYTTKGWRNSGTLSTHKEYLNFVSDIISLTEKEHDIKEVVVSKFVDGHIAKEVVFKR
jgi:hypothetical protein